MLVKLYDYATDKTFGVVVDSVAEVKVWQDNGYRVVEFRKDYYMRYWLKDTIGNKTYQFNSIKTLLATATPLWQGYDKEYGQNKTELRRVDKTHFVIQKRK